MGRFVLSEELSNDYQTLFDTCIIRDDKAAEVEQIIAGITADKGRYQNVEEALAIPWFVVAVIHCLENQRDFSCHLHNGDPLTERTQHLPDGHPNSGNPPFTWEESAIDALKLQRLNQWHDWSIPGILFKLEGYNGWGYRLHHPEVHTPYLWGGSTHYENGKYVAEDSWNDTAVFQACGAAVLLRRMAEQGLIEFADEAHAGQGWPVIRYAESGPWITELQSFLNRFPGIFVKVDGWAGPKTSEAFFKVSGRYLLEDPRAAV